MYVIIMSKLIHSRTHQTAYMHTYETIQTDNPSFLCICPCRRIVSLHLFCVQNGYTVNRSHSNTRNEEEDRPHWHSHVIQCSSSVRLPPGLPQRLSQGLSEGLSQGLSEGLSQGLSQGPSQGLSLALPHRCSRITLLY